MLAIPELRSRVAPVLDWCRRYRLFPPDPAYDGPGQELELAQPEPWERLEVLRQKGVRVLICGALSPLLQYYAKKLGFTVVWGVSGEIDEVRRSFWLKELGQSRFRLPGCRGPGFQGAARRRRRGWSSPGGTSPGEAGGGKRGGPAGRCYCPDCGLRVPHVRGLPCQKTECPGCGRPMVRE